ncbi:hypothetical protein WR25_22754 [Diploscapter pachys]|uniref:Fibroblast growth factor n=1 Tax=Diploscapter pachys TaxID=2018661 RepID=A0A2A2LKS8_9BILA|nr:hypothetical protein WR25_22754 [Diploscapter pachys]
MSSSLVSSSLSPSAIGSFGGGSAAFFADAPPARPEANYIYDLAPASSSSSSSGQSSPSTSNQFPYYPQQQMIDNCAAYAKRLRERQQHERYGTFDEQDSSYSIGAVRRGALFCRSGTWLEVVDDWKSRDEIRRGIHKGGTVRGTRNSNSTYNILEFISVAIGLVSIRGVKSEKYVCMNNNGSLYSTSHRNFSSECIFMEEMMENFYNTYSSCLYGNRRQPWYLALRRTGRPRKGPNTRRRRKSSHFLVAHYDSSPRRPNSLEHLLLPSLIHQPPKKKAIIRSLTSDPHSPTKSPGIQKISARVELAPITKKRKEKRKRRREQRLLREERKRRERMEMLTRLREQERRHEEERRKDRRLSRAGLQIVEKPRPKYNSLHYSSVS